MKMSSSPPDKSGKVLISRKNLAVAYKPSELNAANYQMKLEGQSSREKRRNKRSPFASDLSESHVPSAAVSTPTAQGN